MLCADPLAAAQKQLINGMGSIKFNLAGVAGVAEQKEG